MPRKVRVATTSFHRRTLPTVADNLELATSLVVAAAADRADLVCLPETFLEVGMPRHQVPVVESIPGQVFDTLAALAARHEIWIVAPYSVADASGAIKNTAVVIGRHGELVERYEKIHPTIKECEQRAVAPGTAIAVVETDFGRMGLAICYDIGWPSQWAALAERGAEVVIWPSAYDGGFPLQVYAWLHSYYVVSAVHTEHARIIDITGQVLTSTSRWHRLASATIDLEKELFHIDDQVEKLFQVQQALGHRVEVRALTEEHIFTVESHDPAWPVARIKADFGLESFHDYHARAESVQNRHREMVRSGA
ncbi:MAG: carbon-nitrogen hydrolase family protein [Chloroflexia bacterium]|nr:carbon-nitrogen hydrolase family protein [Chloroflexia bacterium]